VAARNTGGASAEPVSTAMRNSPGWGLTPGGGVQLQVRCRVVVTWCHRKISRPRANQLKIHTMPLIRFTCRLVGCGMPTRFAVAAGGGIAAEADSRRTTHQPTR